MALSRGVPKREKPRNEASGLHWQSGIPPPLVLFLKYAPPSFSSFPLFALAQEGICVCVCVCQGQGSKIEENERDGERKIFFFSMIHGTRLPSSLSRDTPKPTDLVFKIVFSNLCAV